MTEAVRFTKMTGAGNDFVVLGADEAERVGPGLAAWVRRVCRRRFAVGADGVLVVEPLAPDRVRVRYFNADGTPAFCGNGSRCAARFAHARRSVGRAMVLETSAGDVPATVEGERVRLELPPPVDRGPRVLDLGGERLEGRVVMAGVPHFVVTVESVEGPALERWGPRVRGHAEFGPEGSNFDLATAPQDGVVAVRTWERGVEGETLSCGSGAVAAAFTCRLAGGPRTVSLRPASGIPLQVELPGSPLEPSAAILVGDARFVFDGVLEAGAPAGD